MRQKFLSVRIEDGGANQTQQSFNTREENSSTLEPKNTISLNPLAASILPDIRRNNNTAAHSPLSKMSRGAAGQTLLPKEALNNEGGFLKSTSPRTNEGATTTTNGLKKKLRNFGLGSTTVEKT
jgi:hypothetical protein